MRCPEDDVLLKRALGELTEREAAALTMHVTDCRACREEAEGIRRLEEHLRRTPGGGDEAFVAAVMARAGRAEAGLEGIRARVSRSQFWRILGLAAGLCLVAGGAGSWLWRSEQGSFQARGGALEADSRIGIEVLRVRAGSMGPLSADGLDGEDRLVARYWNSSSEPVYLMLFALDQAGTVHWLFPAWLDERTDPESMLVPAHAPSRVTTEMVAPDRPAAGPLRLAAVRSARPLRVRQVEARLRGKTANDSLAPLFPDGGVREWRTTWSTR